MLDPSNQYVHYRYSIDPTQNFGPKFKNRRPPGLPQAARMVSIRDAALPHIEVSCRTQWSRMPNNAHGGRGDVVIQIVKHLAQTESGAMFGLPAMRFNGSDPSAWGVFQFNNAIWQHYSKLHGSASNHPWETIPEVEISVPIKCYTDAAKQVMDAGGSDLFVARGIRVWQRSQRIFKIWMRKVRLFRDHGTERAFERAWRQIDSISPSSKVGKNISRAIDQKLHEGGFLTDRSFVLIGPAQIE